MSRQPAAAPLGGVLPLLAQAPEPAAAVMPAVAPAGASAMPPAAPRPPGSRRRRLWDLAAHAHCPVVGVCLTRDEARKVAERILGQQVRADDHEIHCALVADARQRGRLSEALQRTLDERHALALKQAARAKTPEALVAWWDSASAGAGLPAALWATLTHPCCTVDFEHALLGEVHMRQHAVAHDLREHLAAIEQLRLRHAALLEDIRRQQARHQQDREDWAAERRQLQAERAAAEAAWRALQAAAGARTADEASTPPSRDERSRWRARLREQHEQLRQLRQALAAAQAAQQAAAERQDHGAAPEPAAAAVAPGAAPAPSEPSAASGPRPALRGRQLLCVGGRASVVPAYRREVEACGARFDHHDGGLEHGMARLQAVLGAADAVLCQVGCVSHEAYGHVKLHCKRAGKPCIFVEQPSVAGLRRALHHLQAAAPAPDSARAPGGDIARAAGAVPSSTDATPAGLFAGLR